MSRGQARVAGVDVATDRLVSADLADDIPRACARAPGARAERTLRASRLLGARCRAPAVTVGQAAAATVVTWWPPSTPSAIGSCGPAGRRVGCSSSTRGSTSSLSQEFHFDADRPFYLAFVGVFSLVVLAFVLSYGWSLTQPIRRGHRRRSAYLSMTCSACSVPARSSPSAGPIFGPQPTFATLAVGLALGAGVALSLTQVLVIVGRRARLVRAEARREAAATN